MVLFMNTSQDMKVRGENKSWPGDFGWVCLQ